MFSGSIPNYNKLKTNLRLCVSRLKLLQRKKTELALKQRKEIADYITADKVERAKIRVEHIIREDYLVEAMEVVEMYCDLLLTRFGLIEQMKTLDDGIAEAISSIIWVTPRLQSDVAELKVVSDQLAIKYGKPYANGCKENAVETVSEKLVRKLNVQAPPKLTVEKYLIEIAKYYNIEYEPDEKVLQADNAYAGDPLLDIGEAPALLNIKEPCLQPQQDHPIMQPRNVPFSYPSSNSAQPSSHTKNSFNSPKPMNPAGSVHGVSRNQQLPNYSNHEKTIPFPPPYTQFTSKLNANTLHDNERGISKTMATPNDCPIIDEQKRPTKYISANDQNICGGFVLPNLPEIPDNSEPNHHSRIETEIANEQDDDSKYEEDIDFDDLNRRFEALKRRK